MFVERHEFFTKINRRKRGLRLSAAPAKRQPGGRSLDSFKHLATSEKNRTQRTKPETMSDVLKASTTALDRHRKAYRLYEALMDTMKALAHQEDEEAAAVDRKNHSRRMSEHEAEESMRERYQEAEDAARVDGFIGPMMGIPDRVFIFDQEKLLHPPKRRREWSAQKDYERLSGCQSQWIGFKAACCDGDAVAVPISCNHRLCPLCNSHRAERYRSRVQALFHELGNPQLLTLTVPSPRVMNRLVLDTLRARLKAFLKSNNALLKGGVYSIEITYNSRMKTWHPHVHVLVDVNDTRSHLPRPEFIERKQKLEFAWLVLTQGKRLKGEKKWRNGDYAEWADAIRNREFSVVEGGGRNRRIVDLRPVTKDKKAAYEVLKYMSKASSFIGDPTALKQLLVAIRGVRQIQTFGTAYGFKMDETTATSHLKCECGANDWKPIGTLGLGMVRLSPEGTWYVRRDAPVHGRRHRCRGSST